MCFACGSSNPIGFHLQFESVGPGKTACTFTPGPEYQGWDGVMHGGLVATLLDEGMAWAVLHLGRKAVTAKMELRWRHPVPIGQLLRVEGEVVSSKGRSVEARSTVYLPDGTVGAQAQGIFMMID